MNCLGVSLMNRVGLKDGRTKGISESGLGSSNIKRASVEAEQRDTQTGSAPLDVGQENAFAFGLQVQGPEVRGYEQENNTV